MRTWQWSVVLGLALLAGPAAASDREELGKAFLACQNRDYSTALWIYYELAVHGNAEAQFCLGSMYENGHGIHTSTVYAVKWYTESAEHGFRGAQFRLGCIYAHGEGVPQDDGKAAAWYAQAAEQGDPKAQHLLGTMYEHGQGVPRDTDKAVVWCAKAALQGDAEGVAGMGLLYNMSQRLEGCESQDLVKGYALVKYAARKENERLRRLLEEELKKTSDTMTPAQREEGDALAEELAKTLPVTSAP